MNPENKNSNNQHKAWVRISIGLVSFLIVLSFFGSISQRIIVFKSDFLAEVIPRVLIDLTNRSRTDLALNQLVTSSVLEDAAQRKADDMAAGGYFSHNSPDGKTPWYWFGEAGYDFSYAGENLAIHFSDSPEVVEAWMNSPSHRANIVNENFTEIGIAISQGSFEGKQTIFVVQMFGKPRKVLASNQIPSEAFVEEGEDVEIEEIVIEDEEDKKTIIAQVLENPDLEVLGEDVVLDESNTQNENLGLNPNYAPAYSTLFERLSVSPTLLLTIVYIALIVVVIFLAVLAIIVETRKHHYSHIIYTVGLIILILILYFISTNSLNEVEVLGII